MCPGDRRLLAVQQLQGFESLAKALEELGGLDSGKATRFATRKAAQKVHASAEQKAPVGKRPVHRTYKGRKVTAGFGKRHIIMKVSGGAKKDGYFTRFTANIGPSKEAFYMSQFVELGTKKMRAQQWLRPAMKSTSADALDTFTDEIGKKIKRIAKANAKAKK